MKKIWTAGKSSVLALPKDFVDNLTSENLILSYYEDGFFVRPADTRKVPITVIEVPENEGPNVLKYKIISAYMKNYQDVKVCFLGEQPNQSALKELNSMNAALFGLDVSPISSNEFFVTMSTTPRSIQGILERMLSQSNAIHTINQNLLKDCAFDTSKEEGPTGPTVIEQDIDKNNALVRRLLCRAIKQPDLVNALEIGDLKNVIHWESVNSNLERVGDMEFECYLEIRNLINTLGSDKLKKVIKDEKTDFGFAEYHEKAIQMVNEAYENNLIQIFQLLNTKQPKRAGYLDCLKTRKGYLEQTQCEAIKQLIMDTPQLGRLDIRIWSITSCSTNIAEAWLNMKGPTDQHSIKAKTGT